MTVDYTKEYALLKISPEGELQDVVTITLADAQGMIQGFIHGGTEVVPVSGGASIRHPDGSRWDVVDIELATEGHRQ